jgi:short-subunit dehydrogenase
VKLEQGQKAIVTGASTGLGVHIAEALAKKGVHLALAARNKSNLEKVKAYLLAQYDINVITIPTDIRMQHEIETLVLETVTQFGSIEILVNNAGVENTLWFGDLTRNEINSVIDINLKGTLNLSHLVLKHMIKQNYGHIVNISSGTGYLPMAYNEVYATTKAGIIGFTKALRQSLQDQGVNVSASVIAPGFMDGSGMYQKMKENYQVVAPRILGGNEMKTLTKAFIVAIEKNKPDVIVSAGFPRLIVALSIFNQRTIEKITKVFKVSGFFRVIAERNWAKSNAIRRQRGIKGNIRNLVTLLWSNRVTRNEAGSKNYKGVESNVQTLAQLLWEIDLEEQKTYREESGRTL